MQLSCEVILVRIRWVIWEWVVFGSNRCFWTFKYRFWKRYYWDYYGQLRHRNLKLIVTLQWPSVDVSCLQWLVLLYMILYPSHLLHTFSTIFCSIRTESSALSLWAFILLIVFLFLWMINFVDLFNGLP